MFYCSTFPGNSTELGTVLTIKTPDFVTYTLAWSQICLKSGVRKFLSSEQPSLKIFFCYAQALYDLSRDLNQLAEKS